MKKIEAKIVADSKNEQGDRITTYLLTYPRFIHSELMTHRVFSRNSASSRAIPFEKMVKMVEEDPFIPLVWQKTHKGMQGSKYFTEDDLYFPNGQSYSEYGYRNAVDYNREIWLEARDKALQEATLLHNNEVTKQLCNRLLEPFMWHTILLTSTEFENFFELRCPKYIFGINTNKPKIWKSRKDAIKDFPGWETNNDLFWNTMNYSQAEIHIQALAEAMWNQFQESKPKLLKVGEYHLPFIEIDED